MTPDQTIEAIASEITVYEIGQMEENEGHYTNDHPSMAETFEDIKAALRLYGEANGKDMKTWGFYLGERET